MATTKSKKVKITENTYKMVKVNKLKQGAVPKSRKKKK